MRAVGRRRDTGIDAARRARFERLFAEVYEPLQRYVRRRAAAADADDVVADALLVAWRRLDDVPDEASVAWMYGVARNCLANRRRSAARAERLARRVADAARTAVVHSRGADESAGNLTGDPFVGVERSGVTGELPGDPFVGVSADDTAVSVTGELSSAVAGGAWTAPGIDDPALEGALAELTDTDREVLRLWAWEQLAAAEIGIALGISANAASIRLHRAKQHLSELLGGGRKPTTADGRKPATADGREPATADGREPATADGRKPATADGREPATADGRKPATADGREPATADGRKPATADGHSSSEHREEGER